MIKAFPSAILLASALLLAGAAAPALAQDGLNPPPNNPGQSSSPNPFVNDLGPDAPQPLTGELVPLPGPPPEGKEAEIKLPDCAPPNCGTPQIME
jgi:hypothetical protein